MMKILISARKFVAVSVISAAATVASHGAYAACYAPDQQLPATAVSDFLGSPASLLSNPANAQGGNGLISMVRDLVASNPSALGAIIGLLAQASPAQQQAIGTGLGQAANLCQRPDPNFAGDISQQLATAFPDPTAPVNVAYSAATGKPIGSVANGGAGGGAGGVSGGSVGGSTNPVTNSPTGSSTSPTFTQGGAFTTGTNYFGGTVSGASGVSSVTNNTVSSSVSQ
jgi:hypothetical protein